MNYFDTKDQHRSFLLTALAARREKQVALAIAVVSLVVFLATVPFVRVPLAKMPAFIPSYEAALFFIDLITAVLLFDQCIRSRYVSILMLASGYLFDALIIVPHALSFPGAFAATGLLGAKEQTTAWLYVFWHGGFPIFVIGYALLRRMEANGPAINFQMAPAIIVSVVVVLLVVTALTFAATWGHDFLPIVMQGNDYSLLVEKGISPAVWALTLLAMIALWQREQRVVDLWLMLVMWIWLFDIALAAIIGSTRFDLGFYAGRIFGLIAASFLLIALMIEMGRMYAKAVGAAANAEEQLRHLARPRALADQNPAPLRKQSSEEFIHQQNILRYRSLLENGSIDEAQRLSIERLLSEEESRAQGDGKPIVAPNS